MSFIICIYEKFKNIVKNHWGLSITLPALVAMDYE